MPLCLYVLKAQKLQRAIDLLKGVRLCVMKCFEHFFKANTQLCPRGESLTQQVVIPHRSSGRNDS